jgi:glycosyltransferase involved in cell wall biosynthesis
MKILLIEPYLTGSHAAWASEYAERSAHEVTVLGLEGKHWKWRMHGGAVTLAHLFLAGDYSPDCIIASDMLDLTTFLAMTRERTGHVRTVVYFHENQLTYPWSEQDTDLDRERDAHYGFINYVSALTADAVLFNSRYHLDSFMAALKPFLRAFPDHCEIENVDRLREKSRVLPLGLDLKRFDVHRGERSRNGTPLIIWNHRWEYDKNPEMFFQTLFRLQDEDHEFEVAVLGERFHEAPAIFDEAARRLGSRIVRFGYAEDFDEYAGWLWRADILPVTSIHDFFGASVVQAIYCNCYPLLPRRLAYPEHIPAGHHHAFLYENDEDLLDMLRNRIVQIEETRGYETQEFVSNYDWTTLVPHYDSFLKKLLL